jgi:hypothetical protein
MQVFHDENVVCTSAALDLMSRCHIEVVAIDYELRAEPMWARKPFDRRGGRRISNGRPGR